MKISAKDIARWAQSRDAQASLPRLVRRLALRSGTVTQIAFPAGESVSLPGWDGEIISSDGDPWVPKGRSLWELSCDAHPTDKANRDYKKRTDKTSLDIRRESTLVIVTARHWGEKKAKWEKEKANLGAWLAVRAYDADDLEAWLEQAAPIALDFADELGLSGDGVESVAHYWHGWSSQSDPHISREALFADRQGTKDLLVKGLRQRISDGATAPYAIRADSVEEAAAFVCAALLDSPDLADASLVANNQSGWRFVDRHPGLKIAVAARPEDAVRAATGGVLLIVPVAAGDITSGYGSDGTHPFDLTLERPGIYAYHYPQLSPMSR